MIKTSYREDGRLVISKTSIEVDPETGTKTITTIEQDFMFSDLVIGTLPETCFSCPSGYMDGGSCGRRTPLDSTCRSPDCKLKSFDDYLKENLSSPLKSNAQEMLNLVVCYLLGENYYITDPVNNYQGNLIMTHDLLSKFSKRYRKEGRNLVEEDFKKDHSNS